MKKLLFIIGLALPLLQFAQSDSDFQNFGESIFKYLTDSTYRLKPEFTRIHTMHEIIDKQNISNQEKAKQKNRADTEASSRDAVFHYKMKSLKARYKKELEKGTQFEFLNFHFQPNNQAEGLYNGTLRFIEKSEDLQSVSRVNISFYYNGKGFILTKALKEAS